ncbi:MAG: hypothetical protein OIF58_14525, partial [Cohaesibacter sp.]|nr:hypothetical protein [Cohaesibacter sp.]
VWVLPLEWCNGTASALIFKPLLNFAASFAKASCIFGMSKDEERTERDSVCRSVIYAKRNEEAAIFCQHLQALSGKGSKAYKGME